MTFAHRNLKFVKWSQCPEHVLGYKEPIEGGVAISANAHVQYCVFVCLVEAKETANMYVVMEVMRVCSPAVLGKILANMQCAILSCPL